MAVIQNGTGPADDTVSVPMANSADGQHGASAPVVQVRTDPLATFPAHGPYAQMVGWGYVTPRKVVTNNDLANIVDTSDEWIRQHTGIVSRHIVTDESETSATLGAQAGRQALDVAGVPPQKVGLVICATSTPTHVFPSTASQIQDDLGCINAGAYDLSAACSGFVYALAMARSAIVAGDAEYVLVVGAEVMSRFIDWTDRSTCILFGDGAGALLIAPAMSRVASGPASWAVTAPEGIADLAGRRQCPPGDPGNSQQRRALHSHDGPAVFRLPRG